MPTAHTLPDWRRHGLERRRTDVLAAARAEFAEHGYHAATVDGVAARAEVGKGTVYLDFPGGKAALLDDVLTAHLDGLRALVESAFVRGEGTTRYRFWTLALSASTYFQRHPDLLRIHACELPRLLAMGEGGSAAERLAHLTDELVGVVAPAFEGVSPSPEIAAHHLLATLFGHLVALGLQPEAGAGALARDATPSDIADTLTWLVFDGIAPRS